MKGKQVANQLSRKGVIVNYTGPDISAGWFAIECPYCGDDPGAHLAVNEENGGWHCWRCNEKGPAEKLLSKFGIETKFIPGDGIHEMSAIEAVMGPSYFGPTPEQLMNINSMQFAQDFDAEFTHVVHNVISYKEGFQKYEVEKTPEVPDVVIEYLASRGLDDLFLLENLDVHYTDHGPMAFRVIFPISYRGDIVNYIARDITGRAKARYKVCRDDIALMPLSALLWAYDPLLNYPPEILYICEGIFDAFSFGLTRATCTFKSFLSPLQALLLNNINAGEYRIVYDKGAMEEAVKAGQRLSVICDNVSVWTLEEGIEDPGSVENPEDHIRMVCQF